MKRKFRAKKTFKLRRVIYIILIILLILLFRIYLIKIKFISSNTKLINNILNNNYLYKENNKDMLKNIKDYISSKFFNSPVLILENEFNYKKGNEEPVVIVENETLPLIYLYNSHQGEEYSTKYLEEYNIVPNIMMASEMLKEKLERLEINTIVEKNNILDYMQKNNLDHSGSYIASRYFLKNTMNKYNSIKLYIDLHRDAADHDATYTIINNKECAKVLFVIGLEYDTYNNNLKVASDINSIITTKYPTLSRGIMKKSGYGVNGVYNQDLSSNVILIEIGGNENNIEEVNNTLDILSEVIKEYLNEKK